MKKLYLHKSELPKQAFKNPWVFLKYYLEEDSPETYSDEKCTLYQCRYGVNRSFTDLCRLVQTYFPKTTVKHFAYIFIKFKEKYSNFKTVNIIKGKGYSMLYCDGINRVVLSKSSLYYDWDLMSYSEEPLYCFKNNKSSYINYTGNEQRYYKYNAGGKYSFNNIYKIAAKYRDKELGRLNGVKLIKKYEEDYIFYE